MVAKYTHKQQLGGQARYELTFSLVTLPSDLTGCSGFAFETLLAVNSIDRYRNLVVNPNTSRDMSQITFFQL